jgi:hypothetical protein
MRAVWCVLVVYRRDSVGRKEEERDREKRVKEGQGKVVDVET